MPSSRSPHGRRARPWTSIGRIGVGMLALVVSAAVPSVNASAAVEDSWSTSVTASAATPVPGQQISLQVTVRAEVSTRALVDLEVYDEVGSRLYQQFWVNQPIAAGQPARFDASWAVPSGAKGDLRVRVGVFSAFWGQLYHWNDDALQLTVGSGPSPTAPTTTSVVTTPPTTTSPPPTSTTVPRATTTTTTVPSTTTTLPRATTTTTTVPPTTALPTTTVSPTSTAPTPTTAPPDGAQFAATFETAQDFYDRFRLDVHLRDREGAEWDRVFPGDHDMACGGPTTDRPVRLQRDVDGANRSLEKSELFWWCAPGGDVTKGHIMTGMADVDGYTILSFSPDQSFRDIVQVCWDVNLTDLGGRKWTQVAIVPEAAFQENDQRLDYISPVTDGVDQTAVSMPDGAFLFQTWDHKARLFQGREELLFDWEQFSTDDKAKRYKHCMTDNGDGTVTTTQERDRGTRTLTVRGSFPAHGRVIFQDDNYTPEKDGPLQGFTWHWDNIVIR